MDLPFSREQFFDVFARYNVAVWPMQILLLAIALVALALVRSARGPQPIVGWVLSGLLAWVAIAYHFAFFTRINPSAWLFGTLMLAGAAILAWYTRTGRLRFDGGATKLGRAVGYSLVIYALALYPIVGVLAGQWYPRLPTFGAPCPTTIFVLGMLLLARPPVPMNAFVVPLLWSAVATTAATTLGVPEDFGLTVAGLATVMVLTLARHVDVPARGGSR